MRRLSLFCDEKGKEGHRESFFKNLSKSNLRNYFYSSTRSFLPFWNEIKAFLLGSGHQRAVFMSHYFALFCTLLTLRWLHDVGPEKYFRTCSWSEKSRNQRTAVSTTHLTEKRPATWFALIYGDPPTGQAPYWAVGSAPPHGWHGSAHPGHRWCFWPGWRRWGKGWRAVAKGHDHVKDYGLLVSHLHMRWFLT